jgi:hypothetical protein
MENWTSVQTSCVLKGHTKLMWKPRVQHIPCVHYFFFLSFVISCPISPNATECFCDGSEIAQPFACFQLHPKAFQTRWNCFFVGNLCQSGQAQEGQHVPPGGPLGDVQSEVDVFAARCAPLRRPWLILVYTKYTGEFFLAVNLLTVQIIDYWCDDGHFLVSASWLASANPLWLPCTETGVNLGVRSWKRRIK